MVDSDLMTEVLINLVDNGIKASQEGSQIILTAGENMISVQDFGKGIPEEEQDKILEPFYMIDKSRSRKKGGAGLGLAITASILKKHNCTLEIDSRLGEGTCMKITICL
jgi:two-component system phosphate regulon sensor histidine kinase PhoR